MTTQAPAMNHEFIAQLITNKTQVSLYLRNGVKLTGAILEQDDQAIVFDGAKAENLVFKEAISTIARPKASAEVGK